MSKTFIVDGEFNIESTGNINLNSSGGTVAFSSGGPTTFDNDVTVNGDFIVTGSAATLSSTDTAMKDNIIILNDGEVGAGVSMNYSGIQIDRGSSADVVIRWNETSDKFELTEDGSTYYEILTTGTTGVFLTAVVDDTTPQLGGDLDVNGQSIVTTGGGNIILAPDTTGDVLPGTDSQYDFGATATRWATIYADTIDGTTLTGTLSTATQNSVTTMTGLTTTGALNSGSITNGFGNIDIGTSTIASGDITISDAQPILFINETGVTADNGNWRIFVDSEVLYHQAVNDANSAATSYITVNRTGTTIDDVTIAATTVNIGGVLDAGANNITTTGSVTGNTLVGTLTTAAQTNVTSLGTLTALQVDNININGNTIISTDTNGDIIITPDGSGSTQGRVNMSGTNTALRLPNGATGDRPGTGAAGDIRYNTTTGNVEIYDGAWTALVGVSTNTITQGDSDVTVSDAGTGSVAITLDSSTFASYSAAGGADYQANNITTTGDITGDVITSTSGIPFIKLIETGVTADNSVWRIAVDTETLVHQVTNDAESASTNYLTVNRTANTVDDITIAATTINLTGSVALGANTITTTGAGQFGAGSGAGITATDGTFHVHTASAGGVTANGDANDLVIENSGPTGISILAPDANPAAIYFGSPSDGAAAQIAHTHDSNQMVVGTLNVGHSTVLTSDNNITNLTLSGAGGSETATFAGDLIVSGDFTVNGTTTTINTTNTTVTDKLFELANGTTGSASDDVGMIAERGDDDNVFWGWDETSDEWTVGTGSFTGASTGNLTTTDAAIRVGSATVTSGDILRSSGASSIQNIGSSTDRWTNIYAEQLDGTATSARYADLAENYLADDDYETGTVLSFGGDYEVTQSATDGDRRIAGIVSTAPAHLMNSAQMGDFVTPIALSGRAPCKVTGTVRKGDMMVSNGDGTARAEENPQMGQVIGKALEDFDGETGRIEVVVGRL